MKIRGKISPKYILIGIILLFIALFIAFVKFYGDYLEISEIGNQFVNVYYTNLMTSIVVCLVHTAIIFCIIYLQTIIIRFCLNKAGVKQPLIEKNILVISGCLLISLIIAIILNEKLSSSYLLFVNSQQFDIKDPIFYKDIGYYVFTRPFLLNVFESISYLWKVMMVLVCILYAASYFKFGERTLSDLAKCKPIVNHLAANVVVFMIFQAIETVVKSEDLLFGEFSGCAGAGYVDSTLWVNYYRISPLLMIIITVLVIHFVKKNKIKPALIAFVSYFAVYLIANITSGLIGNIYVSPNESKVEEKYIKYHIDYTKRAYGIDDVQVTDYKTNNSISTEELSAFDDTVNNIRIVDFDATLTATNQLQSLRSYYSFKDLDISVYNIHGKKRAVILGTRELDKEKVVGQNESYVNDKFRYTHGYGAVMASINSVSTNGEPEYIIKDLTQQPSPGIPFINQPRIYFGELDEKTVVVNSKIRELDYSENNEDHEFDYDGKAGVKLTFINKLVLSLRTGDLNLLVSNQITPDSRMLLNRNIIQRAEKVAPFLTFDQDPHIVITSEGKLVWVLDAYTTTDKYPYSQPNESGFNYIRNSVKITVDAYDGTTKFYIIDNTDPIIKAYSSIYPSLFEKEEIPTDILNKTKYPEWLFMIQSKLYERYHTDSPVTFYNKSDMYTVASEKYNNEIREVKPYYNLMKLEEFNTKEPEMIFMLPYTLYNRENMVAWLAAGNSKENYGKLVCYVYPKNYNIYGPLQVENMIDNHSEISKELTLWNSGGSTVIRGNILVIPVMGSTLYVEPVYINSENQASIPVLKRMIAVFGDNIAMEENLDTALKKVFAGDLSHLYNVVENNGENNKDNTDDVSSVSAETINNIADAYYRMENASKNSDWVEFGEAMSDLKAAVEELNNAGISKENHLAN